MDKAKFGILHMTPKVVNTFLDFVLKHNYSNIIRFPLGKTPLSLCQLINEVNNIKNFVLNKNNLFSKSTIPSIYSYIYPNKKLNLLRHIFFNDSFSINSWKQLFYSDIVNKWL